MFVSSLAVAGDVRRGVGGSVSEGNGQLETRGND